MRPGVAGQYGRMDYRVTLPISTDAARAVEMLLAICLCRGRC